MNTPLDFEALHDIARDHHVHYDVESEIAFHGQDRVKTGFRVRLWAVHRRNARALPGCPACAPLLDGLRRIADAVTPPPRKDTGMEIEASHPALYASSVVPGADEVALTIRLYHREGLDRPIDACQESCLREIRGRLKALGVSEA